MRSRQRALGWIAPWMILLANSRAGCSAGRRGPPVFGGQGKQQTPDLDPEDSVGTEFIKVVALVPVRDEAHLLPSCLRSLAPLVHAIVVLDDCSVDGSGDIANAHAEECKIERVARSPNCSGGPAHADPTGSDALPYWGNEAAHRGYLLDLGRSVGGTHFWTIDADEVVVAGDGGGVELEELRGAFMGMAPGDLLVMHYVTMYGSATTFRSDKRDMKAVGFVDQPGASAKLPGSTAIPRLTVLYGPRFHRRESDDRLHTPRVPYFPHPGNAWELKSRDDAAAPATAVLHFGFSNLPNARLKNVIYNLFDVATGSKKTAAEMNEGLAQQGLTLAAETAVRSSALAPAPASWLAALQRAAFNLTAFEAPVVAGWRETLALSLLGRDGAVGRVEGMVAVELLGRHRFGTLLGGTERRLKRMLARLTASA